nr:DUF1697 domain-containing protein [Paenibacillus sp. JCM 10914]
MTTYIALLRGINVGGHHKIKMADLRALFNSLGYDHVQSYIQSGNVLFQSWEKKESLHEQIEEAILNEFGFSVPVILRTAGEIEEIVSSCPFPEEWILEAANASEHESLYVVMLSEPATDDRLALLQSYVNDYERIEVAGENAYLLFRDSVRHSKLAGQLHKLGEPQTMRNWKTMNKLLQLANGIREDE